MDELELDSDLAPAGPRRRIADAERVRAAHWAFVTRRVSRDQELRISRRPLAPRAGDLVLARIGKPGLHRGLQLPGGRTRSLGAGDEIVVAYGDCNATGQFEAVVPETVGACHLVAAGGVAAQVLSWNTRIGRAPTLIAPIGFLIDAGGERVKLADFALEPAVPPAATLPVTIAVVGTSVAAGKTVAAAALAHGLGQAGLRVGYAKVNGTSDANDTWLLRDAGAAAALDFTDAGHASTCRVSAAELERSLGVLVAHLVRADADVIVLELADGIRQPETAALLESALLKSITGAVFLAARDAMGAAAGVGWLKKRGLPVAGIGGVLTRAPLGRSEAATATGLAIYRREDLARPKVARTLLAGIRKFRMISGGNDARPDSAGHGREITAGA